MGNLLDGDGVHSAEKFKPPTKFRAPNVSVS